MSANKRRYIDDDDEVEIVSTSFGMPGPSTGGSSSTRQIVDLNTPPKSKARGRKPQAMKYEGSSMAMARPTIAALDPHAYSYPPAKPVAPPVPTQPSYSESQPPPKKQRKKKVVDPNEPAPEKRGAIFKKACPKNILERVDRVMSQR